jgi:D-proline reductase (dithiol) PrdB
MGSMSEFDLKTKIFLKAYRYRHAGKHELPKLKKELKDCRVGLVTTAGLVPPGQKDFEDMMGGDPSYRLIPNDVDVTTLKEVHRSQSFDHSGIEEDRNLAFPLDRMREIQEEGLIKDLAPQHLSFMGSVTAPGRLIKKTAPEAAEVFKKAEVDLALLIPV